MILPADYHLRRIDRPIARRGRIGPLPVGVLRAREAILPADVIPVIDMQREGQNIIPRRKLAQKRIRRRAARTPLGREKLDHHDPIREGGRSKRCHQKCQKAE